VSAEWRRSLLPQDRDGRLFNRLLDGACVTYRGLKLTDRKILATSVTVIDDAGQLVLVTEDGDGSVHRLVITDDIAVADEPEVA
jgi:hypothetical protein